MKKASHVLFLIGGILTIVGAVALLAFGIVFTVTGALASSPEVPGWVVKVLDVLVKEFKFPDYAAAAKTAVALGIVFIVMFACSIPAAVLSFKCASQDKRGLVLLIVATAFSLVAGSAVSTVGGVLGIFNYAFNESKENKE